MASLAMVRSTCHDPGFPYYTTVVISKYIWDEITSILQPLASIPNCIIETKKRTAEAVVMMRIREPLSFDIYKTLTDAGYVVLLKFGKDNDVT